VALLTFPFVCSGPHRVNHMRRYASSPRADAQGHGNPYSCVISAAPRCTGDEATLQRSPLLLDPWKEHDNGCVVAHLTIVHFLPLFVDAPPDAGHQISLNLVCKTMREMILATPPPKVKVLPDVAKRRRLRRTSKRTTTDALQL
jgi:hypothetical protein